MGSERTSGRGSSHRWKLGLAVVAIVAPLFLTDVVALLEMRAGLASQQLVAGDALESIALVTRLDSDINRQRWLVDNRLHARSPAEASRLERMLAEAEADFDSAALAYAPLANLPGEQALWLRVLSEAQALRAGFARALELSRMKDPSTALDQVLALEGSFQHLNEDVDRLVEFNRQEARRQVAASATRQRRLVWLLGSLMALDVAVATTLGAVLTRYVRRREGELLELMQELERRNRELDAFSGRVAHDLRGPLTAVKLAATRLAEGTDPESGAVAILYRGVARMEMLIHDLLNLSRVEAQVGPDRCDPLRVATSLEEEFSQRLENEGGHLTVEVDPARVRCAEGLLGQALSNLLENALKYRRPEVPPRVELRGRLVEDRYELRISDNGMGMSEEDARHAFEPFYRAERSRAQEGTGLGLAIVKRIIEAYGGEVDLYSRLEAGTTFVINLRLASEETWKPGPNQAPRPALLGEGHPPS